VVAPFAQVEDLVLPVPLTSGERPFAEGLLRRASVKLRDKVPGLDERVLADPRLYETVKETVCAAVERVLNNPKNLATLSTGDGPFTKTMGFGKTAVDALFFTKEELASIVPETSTRTPGMARIA